ncbi:hypothetical protein HanRHA438_Chr11g0481191 [Helianthus annuus]|nr:hypothetical protein HanHA89_Chr10g0366981 [Helianthus annuus]KAJ0535747.1 hypothetical protein HanIR_Chr09g0433991 [Helianthus annuus]KAJ0868703.1 hypothetical protein HanRHA438_Chr11g0481191 [Helianthus annuus]
MMILVRSLLGVASSRMAGALFSACNRWCSHDSLIAWSEPHHVGFKVINLYCSRFYG